jgi:hypothetical protein
MITTPQPVILQQTIYQITVPAMSAGAGATVVEATKQQAAALIRAQGYRVMLGQRRRSYLWFTDGERVAGVEVRRSTNRPGSHRHQYNRYQVPIKGHGQTQLLVMLTQTANGLLYPFLIPMVEIGPRQNIAIWSESPADYRGQWAPYLNDWSQLARALADGMTARDWGLAAFK